MNRIESDFVLLAEATATYSVWRRIVEEVNAVGRANFDARIVAVAEAHKIEAVLTFEPAAFSRYGQACGVVILDPALI